MKDGDSHCVAHSLAVLGLDDAAVLAVKVDSSGRLAVVVVVDDGCDVVPADDVGDDAAVDDLHDYILLLFGWEGSRPPGRLDDALREGAALDDVVVELVVLLVVEKNFGLVAVELNRLNSQVENQGALHHHGNRGLHGLANREQVGALVGNENILHDCILLLFVGMGGLAPSLVD